MAREIATLIGHATIIGDPQDPERVISIQSKAATILSLPGGPPGPPGPTGRLDDFVFTQGSAATSWTVPHNLGRYPDVTVLTEAGEEIEADIRHLSTDTLVISFVLPVAGLARCI